MTTRLLQNQAKDNQSIQQILIIELKASVKQWSSQNSMQIRREREVTLREMLKWVSKEWGDEIKYKEGIAGEASLRTNTSCCWWWHWQLPCPFEPSLPTLHLYSTPIGGQVKFWDGPWAHGDNFAYGPLLMPWWLIFSFLFGSYWFGYSLKFWIFVINVLIWDNTN